jgi:S1-C subfamily serine protease
MQNDDLGDSAVSSTPDPLPNSGDPPAASFAPPAPPAYSPYRAPDAAVPPPPPPPPAPPWGFAGQPQWQPEPHRPARGRRVVAAALAGLFVVGIGTGVVAERLTSSSSPTSNIATTVPNVPGLGLGNGGSSSGNAPTAAPSTTSPDTAAIAAKVTPGIVNITITLAGNGGAAGTGMLITSTGEVLTNNHVIDGETSVSVELPSTGKTYSAHVVGYDLTEDIALVQIDGGGNFTTVSVGNSSTVTVGQAVVALGNALGRNGAPSVTAGNVTHLNQTISASDQSGGDVETVSGLIEVDAQIQPGDSGGPLVTSSGNVIGMDTAAQSAGGRFSQQTSSLAYAIPINKAIQVVRQIQSGKSTNLVHVGATRALLGVGTEDTQNGVRVDTVEPGSPAAGAGIGVGSIITALNGGTVDTNSALRNDIIQHAPGSSVTVTWTDASGASHTSTVVLTTGPPA